MYVGTLYIGCIVLLLLFNGYPAQAEETDQIQRLLEQGQANQAFDVAQSLEFEHIGESRFDFYYGLAALETGHPELAVMALERVLLTHPDSPRVKLELARALFELRDFDAAQTQFDEVLAMQPPDGVKQTIDQFMSAIEVLQSRSRLKTSGFAGLSGGYDSNFNSATSAESFQFQLGTVFFGEEARKQGGGFGGFEAGFGVEQPVSQKQKRYFNSSLSAQNNLDSDEFDTDSLTFSAGLMFALGSGILRTPISAQAIYVDGREKRYNASFGVDWAQMLSPNRQWLTFFQTNVLKNPKNSSRDSNLFVLGTGLSQQLLAQRLQLMSSLSVGHDHALELSVFGKVFASARLGLQWKVSPKVDGIFNLDFQAAQYESQGSFLEKRKDEFVQVNIGAQWQLDEHWQTSLTLMHSDNGSNLALYDYDRSQVVLKGSYQW